MNVMLTSPTYGKFYFDAVFKTDHSATVNVTSNPVQSGAEVSDHAYAEPSEVKMEVGFTAVSPQKGKNADTYITTVLNRLDSIMRACEPVTLTTRLKQYSNMILTAKSYPDDYTTMESVRISLSFKEVRIVSAKTVTVKDSVSSGRKRGSGSGSGTGISSTQTYTIEHVAVGTQKVNAASIEAAVASVFGNGCTVTCKVNGKTYSFENGKIKEQPKDTNTDGLKNAAAERVAVGVQNIKDLGSNVVNKVAGFFGNLFGGGSK